MENINHQPQHNQSYISQMRVNLPKIAQFMRNSKNCICFAQHNGIFFQLIVLPLLVFSVQLSRNYCSDQSVKLQRTVFLQMRGGREGDDIETTCPTGQTQTGPF